MDNEKYALVCDMIDDVLLFKLKELFGREPVYFSALWHCRQHQIIYEGFKNNLSKAEIIKNAKVCKRTVERQFHKFYNIKTKKPGAKKL